MTRFTSKRVPSDDFLFKNGVAGITSFMAKHAITDLGEGFGEYMQGLKVFHQDSDRDGLGSYIRQKVKEKGKRYNTIANIKPPAQSEVDRQAEEYRKAKYGK